MNLRQSAAGGGPVNQIAALIVLVFVSLVFQPIVASTEPVQDDPALCAVPIHLDGVGPACPLADGHFVAWYDDGTPFYTHGPDGIPSGGGDVIHDLDQERNPRCASEWSQHVLYGYPANGEDRHAEVVEYIRTQMRKMNAILNHDALESGGVNADFKVLCDEVGQIRVDKFVVPSSSSDFSAVVSAARNAGFLSSVKDFTIFYDSGHGSYCGVGSFYYDERLSEDNHNNRGGSYGVTYGNCWGGRTPMHENGHNQGAVQRNAPMSDGDAHCLEGQDIMCYPPTNQVLLFCPERIKFDCNHDTYFNADPADGSWLAENWNIGSRLNRFIAFSDTDPAPPNDPPSAAFDLQTDGRTVTLDANPSTDPDGDTLHYAWSLGDGTTATGVQTTHTYDDAGSYTITLNVFDGNGGYDRATATVMFPIEMPPRIETHSFDGHINCAIGFTPVSTNELCADETSRNRFSMPIAEGATAIYAEMSWDDPLAPLSEMTYSWQRPAGIGSAGGPSPVIATLPVAYDSLTHLEGTTGTLEVRPSGFSGPAVDRAFTLCIAVLYGGAEVSDGEVCSGA